MSLERKCKKSLKIGAVVSHLLTFAWMCVIFFMSAQPGDTSGEISGSVSHLFMQVWNVISFRCWNETEILQMAEIWDYPIRKLAHMTEYGILAMFLFWTLGYYKYWQKNVIVETGRGLNNQLLRNRKVIFAWLVTVIYAMTDEFHQLFVPDRAGKVSDVLIDSVGATLALLFIHVVLWMVRKRNRKAKR